MSLLITDGLGGAAAALLTDGLGLDPGGGPPPAPVPVALSGGSSGGADGLPSAPWTLTPDAPATGTLTFHDGGAGGSFSPASLSWSADATPKPVRYTPAAGPPYPHGVTLSAAATAGLTAPAPWSYQVAAPPPPPAAGSGTWPQPGQPVSVLGLAPGGLGGPGLA